MIIMGEQRQAAQPHPDRARAAHRPPGLLRRPLLRHDIPQHATEHGALAGCIARAAARVFLAVEPACRVDAGRAAGSGTAVECNAHPFPHVHAVRFFARGHRSRFWRRWMIWLELSPQNVKRQPLTRFAATLPIITLLGVLAESGVIINYCAKGPSSRSRKRLLLGCNFFVKAFL
jgi:hypothetical protein